MLYSDVTVMLHSDATSDTVMRQWCYTVMHRFKIHLCIYESPAPLHTDIYLIAYSCAFKLGINQSRDFVRFSTKCWQSGWGYELLLFLVGLPREREASTPV